ncbi:hypothetical protein GCM10020256_63050 [Streptomyces thermocoprophilus]
MVGEQCEADRGGVDAVAAQLRDEDEVALGLGHLLAVQRDHPGVDIGLGHGELAGEDLGVRGAHLVVRERQVGAAALDVEAHAEVVQRDGHALDVPAGSAAAEGAAVPAGLAGPGRHPQHRVEGVLLAGAVGVAAALGGQQPHRRRVQVGDLAEVRVGLHGEVDVALQLVRRAQVTQAFDEGDDAGYGLDGADVVLGREHPQRGHVLAEEGGLALGQGDPVDVVALCPLQQRIVDVGDVLDVVNLPLGVEPHALHEVERVVGRRVSHVGGVVGG